MVVKGRCYDKNFQISSNIAFTSYDKLTNIDLVKMSTTNFTVFIRFSAVFPVSWKNY